MTGDVFAEQQPTPSSKEPHTPAPVFMMLAAMTLVLMVLRHALHAKVRRSLDSKSSNDPSSHETNSLPSEDVDRLDPTQPVAVMLVGGDHALGPASVRIFGNLYSREYLQILFVSVGVMDYAAIEGGSGGRGNFRGTEESKKLKKNTRLALDHYLASAHQLGLKADCRVSVATNVVDEIDILSDQITAVYPRAAFFVSKLVFQRPKWFHSILHSGSGDAIRARLEKKGRPITVLPFVVPL
jgi:hypothetical protein